MLPPAAGRWSTSTRLPPIVAPAVSIVSTGTGRHRSRPSRIRTGGRTGARAATAVPVRVAVERAGREEQHNADDQQDDADDDVVREVQAQPDDEARDDQDETHALMLRPGPDGGALEVRGGGAQQAGVIVAEHLQPDVVTPAQEPARAPVALVRVVAPQLLAVRWWPAADPAALPEQFDVRLVGDVERGHVLRAAPSGPRLPALHALPEARAVDLPALLARRVTLAGPRHGLTAPQGRSRRSTPAQTRRVRPRAAARSAPPPSRVALPSRPP